MSEWRTSKQIWPYPSSGCFTPLHLRDGSRKWTSGGGISIMQQVLRRQVNTAIDEIGGKVVNVHLDRSLGWSGIRDLRSRSCEQALLFNLIFCWSWLRVSISFFSATSQNKQLLWFQIFLSYLVIELGVWPWISFSKLKWWYSPKRSSSLLTATAHCTLQHIIMLGFHQVVPRQIFPTF